MLSKWRHDEGLKKLYFILYVCLCKILCKIFYFVSIILRSAQFWNCFKARLFYFRVGITAGLKTNLSTYLLQLLRRWRSVGIYATSINEKWPLKAFQYILRLNSNENSFPSSFQSIIFVCYHFAAFNFTNIQIWPFKFL